MPSGDEMRPENVDVTWRHGLHFYFMDMKGGLPRKKPSNSLPRIFLLPSFLNFRHCGPNSLSVSAS
jgi:hypothetical protein